MISNKKLIKKILIFHIIIILLIINRCNNNKIFKVLCKNIKDLANELILVIKWFKI
jgi:hypothetical protein